MWSTEWVHRRDYFNPVRRRFTMLPRRQFRKLNRIPGNYQDAGGQSSCKICPAGSYCPDNNDNKATPAQKGSSSRVSRLHRCSPRFVQVITLAVHWPGAPARSPRATVARVRRCPSRFAFPGSLFLVLGKYQDTTGQSSCKACPAGAYCQGNNSDHAQLCSPGKYSPNPGLGANDCYMCPKGTYNNM